MKKKIPVQISKYNIRELQGIIKENKKLANFIEDINTEHCTHIQIHYTNWDDYPEHYLIVLTEREESDQEYNDRLAVEKRSEEIRVELEKKEYERLKKIYK